MRTSRPHAAYGTGWGIASSKVIELLDTGCDPECIKLLFKIIIQDAQRSSAIARPLEQDLTANDALAASLNRPEDKVLEVIEEFIHAKFYSVANKDFNYQVALLKRSLSRLLDGLGAVDQDKSPRRKRTETLRSYLVFGFPRQACTSEPDCFRKKLERETNGDVLGADGAGALHLFPPWRQMLRIYATGDPWRLDCSDIQRERNWKQEYHPTILLKLLNDYGESRRSCIDGVIEALRKMIGKYMALLEMMSAPLSTAPSN